MKFPFLLLSAFSFVTAWGLTRWHFSESHPPAATAATMTPVAEKTAIPTPDAHEELAKLLALPQDRAHDEALATLARSFLPTDPEAAFQAAVAMWEFDRDLLTEIAKPLIAADPNAARMLLAKSPDIRSRNHLEAMLMADEVSRNPQEKLAWAEEHLQGYIRIRTLAVGVEALAAIDPDAALAFSENFPPSIGTVNLRIKAVRGKLRTDPVAAANWMLEHLPTHDLGITAACAVSDEYRDHPEQMLQNLPQLPAEFQRGVAEALTWSVFRKAPDTKEAFPGILEQMQQLPPELRDYSLRMLSGMAESDTPGKSYADLLASVSDPAQRTAVIETYAVERFGIYGRTADDPTGPEALNWLNLLKTAADRQAAARVIPYVQGLSPVQRGELVERLK